MHLKVAWSVLTLLIVRSIGCTMGMLWSAQHAEATHVVQKYDATTDLLSCPNPLNPSGNAMSWQHYGVRELTKYCSIINFLPTWRSGFAWINAV